MSLPADLYWKPELPSNWRGVGLWLTLSGGGVASSDWVGSQFGFNLGVHVGDDVSQVQVRRQALGNLVGAPIVWLDQVHGCSVALVDEASPSPDVVPQADASMTTHCDKALAIMTADCLPAVFAAFDPQGKAIGVAAAHAGWRGLHAGVLQAAVNALRGRLGAHCVRMECFLGPAIGPLSFEVGEEVRTAFVEQNPKAAAHFQAVPGQTGKHLADLYALARLALSNTGIDQFHGGGQDTLTNSRWFSHRRGQQQGLPAGRFATVVRLLPP